MPYPSRPVLDPLPQFAGTARNGVAHTDQQHRELMEFVVREYNQGRSLRQLGELTDRSQTAVRRLLDEAGVQRRSRGAAPASDRSAAGG